MKLCAHKRFSTWILINLTLTRKLTWENKRKWIKSVHALKERRSLNQMCGGLEFNQHGFLRYEHVSVWWGFFCSECRMRSLGYRSTLLESNSPSCRYNSLATDILTKSWWLYGRPMHWKKLSYDAIWFPIWIIWWAMFPCYQMFLQ